MFLLKTLPKFILTNLQFLLFNWSIFLIARLIMLILLWENIITLPLIDTLHALYIGSKFDMRIAVFISLPFCITLSIPYLEKHIKKIKLWIFSLYGIIFGSVLCIYFVDFGYFFYIRQRIDITLFDFLKDPLISANMVKESYPLYWLIVLALTLLFLYLKITKYILNKHTPSTYIKPIYRIFWSIITIVSLFLLSYGQISSNLFPLRWSNAYFTVNSNLVILGLNPIQNLFDTYRITQNIKPDIEATRNSYERIAQWLHVPNPSKEQLTFLRTEKAYPNKKPVNIVIIIVESLAWPRTSLAPGNDNPTPNLKNLTEKSLLFPLFFSPARTTARAIFTTMTGIPDVNRGGGTSSRNQNLISQNLIMNEFKGYEKYYLIGGSASWANIRGILTHNIEGLHLLEEGFWESPNVNVWGISDLALFQEAIGVFNKAQKPFIAVIQTTGFHRPYTIPKDNTGFSFIEPTIETLQNYGYENSEEYNSMRFSDHALGVFFLLAQNQSWFNDTIFAILGDHGLSEPSKNMPPGYLACKLQDSHIPLLLYSPGKITPGIYPYPCGQTDLFPTLASLIGIPYKNKTLGRDLLNPINQTDNKQFISGSTESFIRLVQNGYCYIKEESEGLYDFTNPELINLLEIEPERAHLMRQTATDFFNTAKYMLYNNK